VEEIEVEPGTSRVEEITHKLFRDLNRDLLRIPGDGALIILSDCEEKDEGVDVVPTKASPQSPRHSQAVTATDEEDGILEDDIKPNALDAYVVAERVIVAMIPMPPFNVQY
jgi:hypothetical protein